MNNNIRYAESKRMYFRGVDIVNPEEIVAKVNAYDKLIAALNQFSGPDGDYYGPVTAEQMKIIKEALA